MADLGWGGATGCSLHCSSTGVTAPIGSAWRPLSMNYRRFIGAPLSKLPPFRIIVDPPLGACGYIYVNTTWYEYLHLLQ